MQKILAQNAVLARQPTSNGQTAIQFAARGGHAGIVAALLEHGADPLRGSHPNRNATNALASARDRGHDEVVDLIENSLANQPEVEPDIGPGKALFGAAEELDLGDEGTYDNSGQPLWHAAKGDHYEVCRLLLEAGADPHGYVYACGPAAERAMENGNDELRDLICSYGGHSFSVAAALCGRMAVPAEVMHLKPELAGEILWGAALSGHVDLARLSFRYDPFAVSDMNRLLAQPLRGTAGASRHCATPMAPAKSRPTNSRFSA